MTRWFGALVLLVASGSCAGCTEPPPCDADGDGVRGPHCGGQDCDDDDPGRFPGNPETCDAADEDEDCDPTTYGVRDVDGDGHGDARCCNVDPVRGTRACGGDCDDLRPGTHPVSVEVCNSLDDDCDSSIDEGIQVPLYPDGDLDGYGSGSAAVQGCSESPGHSYLNNDCDDTNAAIVPGAMRCLNPTDYQICDNGMWGLKATCPGNGICRAQPNGTGVCF